MLAGQAATIEEARIHLRRIGAASMHQAHVFAAAGLAALERLPLVAEGNRRARDLARRLAQIDGVTVNEPPTNLVLWSFDGTDAETALAQLARAEVLALAFDNRVRLVTHSEIDDEAVAHVCRAVAAFG